MRKRKRVSVTVTVLQYYSGMPPSDPKYSNDVPNLRWAVRATNIATYIPYQLRGCTVSLLQCTSSLSQLLNANFDYISF
jgi:hypothetical protein